MPAFIKFDGVDGEVNAAHSEANVELTLKVLDAGGTFYGAMTDVDLAIRVADTAQVTERESGLIYSGESGGMNEAGSDPAGPFSFGWGAETSAAEASGPMKESMETMKKAWKDASSTPEGAGHAAGANWAFGDGSVRDAAGPFVAYGNGFIGGVFVGASDAVPNGRLYLATDVGVFEQGGGDDLLIGGLTGFEPLPGQFTGFDLV